MVGTSPEKSGGGDPDRLEALDRKIREAREARAPKPEPSGGKYSSASMAWRMVFELVFAMVIGGAMGWGLDSVFGTLPLFLIVFWLLGFASGIRLVMHSAREVQQNEERRQGQ